MVKLNKQAAARSADSSGRHSSKIMTSLPSTHSAMPCALSAHFSSPNHVCQADRQASRLFFRHSSSAIRVAFPLASGPSMSARATSLFAHLAGVGGTRLISQQSDHDQNADKNLLDLASVLFSRVFPVHIALQRTQSWLLLNLRVPLTTGPS